MNIKISAKERKPKYKDNYNFNYVYNFQACKSVQFNNLLYDYPLPSWITSTVISNGNYQLSGEVTFIFFKIQQDIICEDEIKKQN